jgi:hypothetical protein
LGSDKAAAAEKAATTTKAAAERGTEMAGAEKATTAEIATPKQKNCFERMEAGAASKAKLLGNPSRQLVKLVASPEAHVSHPPPGSAPPADW